MSDCSHPDAPPPYYPNPRYSKGSASSTDGKSPVDDKVPADDKAPVDDKPLVDDKVSDDDEVPVDEEESSLKSDYITQQAWAVLKQLGNLQENVLTQLKKYDTIVVLDDSGSMTSEHRWEDARESLAIFSRIITKYDDDGMDLHFLNRTGNNTKGIKRPEIVERLCKKRPHRDFGTDIGAALTKIVDPYLKKLEAAKADAIAEAAGIVEAAAIAKAAALARATPWVPAPAPTPTPAEVPVPEPVSAPVPEPVSAPEPEPVTVPVPAPIPIAVKSSGFYTRMKSVFHRREIPGPAAPAPTIPARAAPARAIPAPTIPAPVILAPVILAPSAPVIIAPTIPAPTIPAPTIPAPVILAPAIPAPVIKPIFPKPLNIIVITDGHPTDEDVVVQIIRKAARATADLDEFPRIQIGFQFVQVGSSWSAKQWLEKLDDDKETLFARDIVDTRPYSGKALDVCLLLSVLIGAFEKNTDKADAEMWCEMREDSDALPEKRR